MGDNRIRFDGRIEPVIGNIADGDTVVSSDRARMFELFGDMPTASGAPVTWTSAMKVSVVYACVRLMAGAIAGLPKAIYERVSDDEDRKVRHDYWWLLNERPCSSFSAATMWEYIMTTVLLRGDMICYLVRNRAGVVTAIIPWPRSKVEIIRTQPKDPRAPAYNTYYFHSEAGSFGAQEDDVLHFAGFGFDGCKSMSVIQWGARSGIGIAIRSDEFAGKFFSSGAQPQFALKTPNKMDPKLQDELRDAWVKKYSGTGPNGIPLILTEGLDVQELTMTAQDAQLLESRQYQVVDIARAFGVPPFMVAEMGKATYNNTENLSVDFVKYTLGPHLVRFEQEMNIKLFRGPRYYTRCNVDGLQRADLAARSTYYKAAIGGTQNPAWMTPNEIRRLENAPPLPGGDQLYQPKGTTDGSSDPQQNAEAPAAGA